MVHGGHLIHLGHENIIRYSNRPFRLLDASGKVILDDRGREKVDIKKHDSTIIANINDRVLPGDTLYILGDFSYRSDHGVSAYRDQIHCKNIVLIMGNHDPHRRSGAPDSSLTSAFQSIRELMKIRVEVFGVRQEIVLCHYAMRTWNKSHHGIWHLYGHSHGELTDDPNSLSFDVGVDSHAFCPLNVMDIAAIMSEKTFTAIHHNRKHRATSHEMIVERWREHATSS